MSVRWRAFPLHPETPEDGQSLTELFRASPEKIASMVAHLQDTAAELGLPFGPRSTTYNSRLAQELGKWAINLDREDQYHKAIFKAYFADGLNLGKVETLLTIVECLGFEKKEAAKVLAERLYKNEVDKDWQASQVKGVTAVPTFIMGRDKVVGAQSYQVLEQLLQQNGAGRRS